ncbi:MAG: hypothetical protein OXG49_17000 [Chloroflexi bacterium]|nr:hypothetical protein [Chloroflexota bacterium]
MKNEPQSEKDIFSDAFVAGPGLKDGGYAIVAVDVLTNHGDFACPDMSRAMELIAEIQGKHITELQLPSEAELQNWTEDPCEPYALSLDLENGASLWLPLIDMDGEDGRFHVHTDMVENTSKQHRGVPHHRGTSHNEAATASAVSRAARRRAERAARKAAKRPKST